MKKAPGNKKNKEKAALSPLEKAGQRLRSKYNAYQVKEAGELLDFLMKAKDGISRTTAKSLLSHRQVLVEDVITTQYNFALKPGMTVKISKEKGKKEFSSPYLKLLYEDRYLLVVEKREGLAIVGKDPKERSASSILNEYMRHAGLKNRVFIVHPLDKEASGLVLFAKDEKTKDTIRDHWEEIVREQAFVAVLKGETEKDKGMVTSWMVEGKVYVSEAEMLRKTHEKASTRYKAIKRRNGFSLVEMEPTLNNKIRLHASELKHPVLGDPKYDEATGSTRQRMALHAFRLQFHHPVTGDLMKFETPYPQGFKKPLEKETAAE